MAVTLAKKARPTASLVTPTEPQIAARGMLDRPAMLALLLCGIALVAYANSFGLGLATDARVIVQTDTRIRELSVDNLGRIFNSDYWWPQPIDVLYRPVTILSYLFNYAVLGNGQDAAGYHAVNFLLHAVNVLLVFTLCRRLFQSNLPAFFAAALWAVHPVGTESVTNVSGRADVLATAGVLGGLALYLAAREWNGRRAIAGIAGVFALTVFGAFSKESGAVLPGLMLLWDTLDFGQLRRQWKRRVPFYGAAAAALLLLFWMRHRIFAARPWPIQPYLDNPLILTDFWTARFTAIKVLGLQLWLMVCPLRLTADRSYQQIAMSPPGDLWAWCALAVVVAIVGAAVMRYRRDRVIYFAVGFTAITMLPTSNLVVLIGSIMAERFLYLPSVGLAIAVTALAFRLREERTARAILVAVLVVFAGRTFVRNFDWNDNLTLFAKDVTVSLDSFHTHDMLARALFVHDARANIDRAILEGEAACRIVRDLPLKYLPADTLRHQGLYYATKGDMVKDAAPDQALMWWQKALPVLLRHARGLSPTNLEYYPSLSIEYFWLDDGAHAADMLLEKGFLDGMKPDLVNGLRQALGRVPGGECAVTGLGEASTLNFGCPLLRQRTCIAMEDLAQSLVEARQAAQARAQREKASRDFGCAQP